MSEKISENCEDAVVASWPLYLVNTNTEGISEEDSAACSCLEPFPVGRQLRRLESLEPHETYAEDLLVEFDLFKATRSSQTTHLMSSSDSEAAFIGMRWKAGHQMLEAFYNPASSCFYQHKTFYSGELPAEEDSSHHRVADNHENPHGMKNRGKSGTEKNENSSLKVEIESRPLSESRLPTTAMYRLSSTVEHGEHNTVLLRKVSLPEGKTAFIMVPMHAVLHMSPSGLVYSKETGSSSESGSGNIHQEAPVAVDVIFRRTDRNKSQVPDERQVSQSRQTSLREPWTLIPYAVPKSESGTEALGPNVLETLSQVPPARFICASEMRDRLAPPCADSCFKTEKYHMDSQNFTEGFSVSIEIWTGSPESGSTAETRTRDASRSNAISTCVQKLLRRAQVVPFERLLRAVKASLLCEESEVADVLTESAFLVRGAIVLDSALFYETGVGSDDSYGRHFRLKACKERSMLRTLILALFDAAEPDGVLSATRLLEMVGHEFAKQTGSIMDGIALKLRDGSHQFLIKRSGYMYRKFPETARILSQRLRTAADLARKELSHIHGTRATPAGLANNLLSVSRVQGRQRRHTRTRS
jgi:hypothetical protein